MAQRNSDEIILDQNHKGIDRDGIDRRGFLKRMAWAGPGALCVIRAEF
jgi:hypothetical protein